MFFITDAHHAVFDEDLVPAFIQLSNEDDVGGEAWQEIDVGEQPCSPFLQEEHGVEPFNLSDGAITKMNRPYDTSVDIGKGSTGSRHMVGRVVSWI